MGSKRDRGDRKSGPAQQRGIPDDIRAALSRRPEPAESESSGVGSDTKGAKGGIEPEGDSDTYQQMADEVRKRYSKRALKASRKVAAAGVKSAAGAAASAASAAAGAAASAASAAAGAITVCVASVVCIIIVLIVIVVVALVVIGVFLLAGTKEPGVRFEGGPKAGVWGSGSKIEYAYDRSWDWDYWIDPEEWVTDSYGLVESVGLEIDPGISAGNPTNAIKAWMDSAEAELRVPVASPCAILQDGYGVTKSTVPLPPNGWALTAADASIEAAAGLRTLIKYGEHLLEQKSLRGIVEDTLDGDMSGQILDDIGREAAKVLTVKPDVAEQSYVDARESVPPVPLIDQPVDDTTLGPKRLGDSLSLKGHPLFIFYGYDDIEDELSHQNLKLTYKENSHTECDMWLVRYTVTPVYGPPDPITGQAEIDYWILYVYYVGCKQRWATTENTVEPDGLMIVDPNDPQMTVPFPEEYHNDVPPTWSNVYLDDTLSVVNKKAARAAKTAEQAAGSAKYAAVRGIKETIHRIDNLPANTPSNVESALVNLKDVLENNIIMGGMGMSVESLAFLSDATKDHLEKAVEAVGTAAEKTSEAMYEAKKAAHLAGYVTAIADSAEFLREELLKHAQNWDEHGRPGRPSRGPADGHNPNQDDHINKPRTGTYIFYSDPSGIVLGSGIDDFFHGKDRPHWEAMYEYLDLLLKGFVWAAKTVDNMSEKAVDHAKQALDKAAEAGGYVDKGITNQDLGYGAVELLRAQYFNEDVILPAAQYDNHYEFYRAVIAEVSRAAAAAEAAAETSGYDSKAVKVGVATARAIEDALTAQLNAIEATSTAGRSVLISGTLAARAASMYAAAAGEGAAVALHQLTNEPEDTHETFPHAGVGFPGWEYGNIDMPKWSGKSVPKEKGVVKILEHLYASHKKTEKSGFWSWFTRGLWGNKGHHIEATRSKALGALALSHMMLEWSLDMRSDLYVGQTPKRHLTDILADGTTTAKQAKLAESVVTILEDVGVEFGKEIYKPETTFNMKLLSYTDPSPSRYKIDADVVKNTIDSIHKLDQDIMRTMFLMRAAETTHEIDPLPDNSATSRRIAYNVAIAAEERAASVDIVLGSLSADRLLVPLEQAQYQTAQCHEAVATVWLWSTALSILEGRHPLCSGKPYEIPGKYRLADGRIVDIQDVHIPNVGRGRQAVLDAIVNSEEYRNIEFCQDKYRPDDPIGTPEDGALYDDTYVYDPSKSHQYAYDMCLPVRPKLTSDACEILHVRTDTNNGGDGKINDADGLYVEKMLVKKVPKGRGWWRISPEVGRQGMVSLALAAAARHHLEGDGVMTWSLAAQPTGHWLDNCVDYGDDPFDYDDFPMAVTWPEQITAARKDSAYSDLSMKLPFPFEPIVGENDTFTIWSPIGCHSPALAPDQHGGRRSNSSRYRNNSGTQKVKLWPQIGPLMWYLGVTPSEAKEVIGAALDLGIIRGVFDNIFIQNTSSGQTDIQNYSALNTISKSLKDKLLPKNMRTPGPDFYVTDTPGSHNNKYRYVTRAVEAMTGTHITRGYPKGDLARAFYMDQYGPILGTHYGHFGDYGKTMEYQLGMMAWAFQQCRSLGNTLGDDCDFATIVDSTKDKSSYDTRVKNAKNIGSTYKNIHLNEPDLKDKLDNYFSAIEMAHRGKARGPYDTEFDTYTNFFDSDDTADVFNEFTTNANSQEDLDGGMWMTWPIPCHWLWMLFGDCDGKPAEINLVLQLFGYAPPPADSTPQAKMCRKLIQGGGTDEYCPSEIVP